MTTAEILKLSETDHTPGLHRAENLARKIGASICEASYMLKKLNCLQEINAFRFIGPGYQMEIGVKSE